MHVAYFCDRKQCENCHKECNHTTDITHAANFECVLENEQRYMEKPVDAHKWEFNDAVKFIGERCVVNTIDIETVLELELEYMRSIGLVIEED